MMDMNDLPSALAQWAPLMALAVAALLLLLVVLLIVLMGRVGRTAGLVAPLNQQIGYLGQHVQNLSDGQVQLSGGLQAVSQTQTVAQAQLMNTLEQRLAEVQANMQESLHGGTVKTTRSLAQLQERLATIDKAQSNIEKLSGDVLSLQDILSNKQTRGSFGEIQLNDIVSKALPADSYAFQVSLSNGRRADCLIDLPNPPGPIVIDSKFPLEAYEALRNASNDWETKEAVKAFRQSVKAHIKAIAERYIIDGETADGALMFLPSEAVYAELHANFPDLVRGGFAAHVWIVSPTTCMATLNTMRAILKDARMREQAGAIRKVLRMLHRDVEMVVERAGKLDNHFNQARKDLEGIGIAAERAGKRAARLDNFDFEELTAQTGPEKVLRVGKSDE
ncbi:MAG: DNA recombination protein RmuC [Rhodobacterales bacterium]|nr:MAG: DNA recombination protein RmuC [Rhodobacterales bacterium]